MTFLIMLAVLLGLITIEAPTWCFAVFSVVAIAQCLLYIRKINSPA